jgi:hypothetical protein
MPARRFPPPWSVEEQSACFVVRDHNGQALAYVYFEDEPGRRSAAKLTRIAVRPSIGGETAEGIYQFRTEPNPVPFPVSCGRDGTMFRNAVAN